MIFESPASVVFFPLTRGDKMAKDKLSSNPMDVSVAIS